MTAGVPVGSTTGDGSDDRAVLARLERLPFTRVHLRVATILGVGTFFDSFDAVVLSVALTPVLTSLGAPLSVAGVLLAAGYVGQAVGGVAFGVVSERFGRRPAFITASALFGVLSVVAAFAGSVGELIGWRVAQGVGLGAEVPIAAAMFNEFVRAHARGRIVMLYESLFVWGILAASLVSGLFLAVLPPEQAWRGLFLLGGIPVLAALWAWWRLPESPRHLVRQGRVDEARRVVTEIEAAAPDRAGRDALPEVGEPDRAPTRFAEMFAPAYRSRTAMLWVTWFTTYFAVWGFTTWTPTLLVRVGGLSSSTAALLTGAITIGDMIAVYLAAATLDRIGRRFWFLTGYAVALVGGAFGVVAIGLLHATGWPVLFTALAIVLIGVNINAPLLYMYNAELYPTRMRAYATTVGASLRNVAAIIAPIVLGLLVTVPGGFGWTFVVFGAVLLIGLLVFVRHGVETARRPLEALAS